MNNLLVNHQLGGPHLDHEDCLSLDHCSVFGISPHLAIHQIAKRYGDVCLVRLGNVPTVIISHPDLLREAFPARSCLTGGWAR